MSINWSHGYSCIWRAYEVIKDTWADGHELTEVESANVERSCDGDAPLIESGEIRLTQPIGENWPERYVRLVMIAEQNNELERVDVCTLLCSTSSGEVNRGIDSLKVTGRSVLWPASVARIDIGSYAPAGTDGAALAAKLLREVIAAPVVVEGSFELASHVVYDVDQTILSVVWNLLNAGNFTIRITGQGEVHIGPVSDQPALMLDQAHVRLLSGEESIPHELDLSSIPNRYVAIEGAEVGEAVNDDPNSITSIPYRGYRYDKVDSSPVRIGGETLTAYANRKLEEASVAHDTREWSREWWPNVVPGDLVRASITSAGIEGDFRIVRQSLNCSYGISVDEQARKDVNLWTRS